MTTDVVEGWHFLRADGCLNYPPHTKVEVGETLRLGVAEEPVLCRKGFHASLRAQDALKYAPRSAELFACRVQLGGVVVNDADKLVASQRTVIWMVPARKTLVGWACWCATGALFGRAVRGRKIDSRSLAALVAVDRFLRDEIGAQEMRAAAYAAADAADAYAAADAADAAAAAYAAAYAADAAAAAPAYAYAADAAAGRARARSLTGEELERRLFALAP